MQYAFITVSLVCLPKLILAHDPVTIVPLGITGELRYGLDEHLRINRIEAYDDGRRSLALNAITGAESLEQMGTEVFRGILMTQRSNKTIGGFVTRDGYEVYYTQLGVLQIEHSGETEQIWLSAELFMSDQLEPVSETNPVTGHLIVSKQLARHDPTLDWPSVVVLQPAPTTSMPPPRQKSPSELARDRACEDAVEELLGEMFLLSLSPLYYVTQASPTFAELRQVEDRLSLEERCLSSQNITTFQRCKPSLLNWQALQLAVLETPEWRRLVEAPRCKKIVQLQHQYAKSDCHGGELDDGDLFELCSLSHTLSALRKRRGAAWHELTAPILERMHATQPASFSW